MSDQNAVLALQNAWQGVLNASVEIEKLAQSVAALPDSTVVSELDLAVYRKATLSQSLAVAALYGLVEELQRKLEAGKQA